MTRDLGAIMTDLRSVAREGASVVVVSSLNRRGYDDASLSAFHGSAELEYQCDNAFVMTEESADTVRLVEVANRHRETRDCLLRFEKHIHRFTGLEGGA